MKVDFNKSTKQCEFLGLVFVGLGSEFFWDVPCHTPEEWRPQI